MSDIAAGIQSIQLAVLLARQDIRQRYRRSLLGPFWITVSTGVTTAVLAVVFGEILNLPLSEFLPFLAIGLIIWGFIQTTIDEGCVGFITAEQTIKQIPLPFFVHIERIVIRNLIILAHNAVIVPLVLLAFGRYPNFTVLVFVFGLLLLVLNLLWITLILAVVCTRYRDFPQIIRNVLQVAFYFTPIIWVPDALSPGSRQLFVNTNPLYHQIELIRGPLVGVLPSIESWVFVSITIVIGWGITLIIFQRHRSRIAYWL